VIALLATAAAFAASPAPVRLEPVARFSQPVDASAPRDDSRRLFVVERFGRIRVIRDGRKLRRPFLDLRSVVEVRSAAVERDQGGLLSLAFAPDYATSGLFYVLYTDRADRLRIDELRRSRASADRADPGSRRLVLDLPRTDSLDEGSHLAFGPDRWLYAAFGFGADEDVSQSLSSLAGKLIRIDPRGSAAGAYTVPADNPFVSTPGARPEIWALGLRVPWRFSFDRKTGGMALADVGEGRVEEVDYAPRGTGAGANYGFPFLEGDHRRRPGGENLTAPVLVRPHSRHMCALIGGVVVRDPRLRGLVGRYLYGDLCSGEIHSIRLRLPRVTSDRRERFVVPGVSSFAEDARGRVYAMRVSGVLYRLVAEGS
jgi:glucose/arabinose dehydrogenase